MDSLGLREQLGKSGRGRARVLQKYELRRNVEALAAFFAQRIES